MPESVLAGFYLLRIGSAKFRRCVPLKIPEALLTGIVALSCIRSPRCSSLFRLEPTPRSLPPPVRWASRTSSAARPRIANAMAARYLFPSLIFPPPVFEMADISALKSSGPFPRLVFGATEGFFFRRVLCFLFFSQSLAPFAPSPFPMMKEPGFEEIEHKFPRHFLTPGKLTQTQISSGAEPCPFHHPSFLRGLTCSLHVPPSTVVRTRLFGGLTIVPSQRPTCVSGAKSLSPFLGTIFNPPAPKLTPLGYYDELSQRAVQFFGTDVNPCTPRRVSL